MEVVFHVVSNQIEKNCKSKSSFHQPVVIGSNKVFICSWGVIKSPLIQEEMPGDFKELAGGGICETSKGQALKSQ